MQDGGEKTEKPDTKEKEPEATAGAGGKVKKCKLQAKLPKGSPAAAEACSSQELAGTPDWLHSRKAMYKREYSAAEFRIEKKKQGKVLVSCHKTGWWGQEWWDLRA